MSWFRVGKLVFWRGWFGKGLLVVVFLVFLFVGSFDEFVVLPVDLVILPYRYSVVNWELSNLSDKWVRSLVNLWPGSSGLGREEGIERTRQFFEWGLEVRGLERRLLFADASFADGGVTDARAESLAEEVYVIESGRDSLRAAAEEIIESEIALIVKEEGLSAWFGVFPPVDVVFSRSPHILIFSLRDRIERQRDVLLNPGLSGVDKALIEDRIVELEDWSVYIADTGGVAVYPSVVGDVFGLRNAVEITAHEWLHQWLLFRPLGRNFWSSSDMTTLNETVATVAGRELGDLAFESLTGEQVVRRAESSGSVAVNSDGFDFRVEMQETRLHAETLLAEGKIEQAEAYMEARRKVFVDHGFFIRKLNQAYFAFHGTYAASAASISPIGDQVQGVRDRSSSLREFLDTMSGFGSYPEFVDYLEDLPDG